MNIWEGGGGASTLKFPLELLLVSSLKIKKPNT